MSIPHSPTDLRSRPTRRLSQAECHEWLTSHRQGRLGYSSGRGPRSVVVNYSVADEQIVVRVPDYNDIAHYAPGSPVTFDVEDDPAEPAARPEAVSVSGTAALVDHADELGGVTFAESWPEGVTTAVVRVPLTAVEGFERADR
jgi:nitroimidazol reductase NimA-like FMN-containing flavoprotein (pyridoxamine 5'-phosphate oxidase superfamily)